MLGCGRRDASALTHDAVPRQAGCLRELPTRSEVGPFEGIFGTIFFKPNDVNK
jgi:hypothetical protein